MRRLLSLICFLAALTAGSLNFSELDFLYGPGFGARVVDIADGDTITVTHGRTRERIRLYGIDCPEKLQEFGQEARAMTVSLISGGMVSVIPVHQDRYGRTVAYVFGEDGSNINYALVSKGLAWWYRQYARGDINLAYRELVARLSRRGLWSDDDPVPPWIFRKGVSVTRDGDDGSL